MKYRTSLILFFVFEAIAVWLWLATGKLFFLLNFSYIGICLSLGTLLFAVGRVIDEQSQPMPDVKI